VLSSNRVQVTLLLPPPLLLLLPLPLLRALLLVPPPRVLPLPPLTRVSKARLRLSRDRAARATVDARARAVRVPMARRLLSLSRPRSKTVAALSSAVVSRTSSKRVIL
jgi:hypothetical protein